ncbi:hypothetical protein G7Z17_g1019 [Cylindrodendrum hubeiense]|uniref:Uncharacterized protein n=1 Tax=Cylindrodendrum hubeiense TaxID=595255 RepID=A0A9P5HFL0_9HYPO|nr:hypothetical protein G7Z17_g1019 [Cylindrodendrum hubeiense]
MKEVAPGPVAVLVSGWALVGIATALVVARLYLRLKIQRRRVMVSDIVMSASWIAGIATTAFTIVFARLDALDPRTETTMQNFPGNPENIQKIFKVERTTELSRGNADKS